MRASQFDLVLYFRLQSVIRSVSKMTLRAVALPCCPEDAPGQCFPAGTVRAPRNTFRPATYQWTQSGIEFRLCPVPGRRMLVREGGRDTRIALVFVEHTCPLTVRGPGPGLIPTQTRAVAASECGAESDSGLPPAHHV